MSLGKTTRHGWITCPACSYRMDCSTPLEGNATPKPGDFTLCISCGELLQYGKGLQFEAIPDDDFLKLPPEEIERLLDLEERTKALIAKKRAAGEWIGQRK
jgi:hypothetical protein